ncbi:MAG: hypothetical protein HKO59_13910 [Phycisphaerales bacterium]|nr:hypothetical protein [Phycisphaerales bacterium]
MDPTPLLLDPPPPDETNLIVRALAGAMAIVGTALLAAVIVNLRGRDRRRHGPAFRQLARSVPLERRDQRLLRRLAHAGGFRAPATLLVSRGGFDHAAARMTGVVPAARLATLRRRLYPGDPGTGGAGGQRVAPAPPARG